MEDTIWSSIRRNRYIDVTIRGNLFVASSHMVGCPYFFIAHQYCIVMTYKKQDIAPPFIFSRTIITRNTKSTNLPIHSSSLLNQSQYASPTVPTTEIYSYYLMYYLNANTNPCFTPDNRVLEHHCLRYYHFGMRYRWLR